MPDEIFLLGDRNISQGYLLYTNGVERDGGDGSTSDIEGNGVGVQCEYTSLLLSSLHCDQCRLCHDSQCLWPEHKNIQPYYDKRHFKITL